MQYLVFLALPAYMIFTLYTAALSELINVVDDTVCLWNI